jgi:chromosome partitioning protein
MKTLALLARKGGAGKTTLAVHLAVAAVQSGRRVLLVDTDPQGSTVAWWQSRQLPEPELVEADAGRLGAVLQAARADGVDLVVVDTRPSVEADTSTVARLADLVVIPTRPTILDLRAIRATVEVVRDLRRPGVVVLNQTAAPRDGGEAPQTAEAREALEAYGLPVAPVAIGSRVAMSHALTAGEAVTEFDPTGKAATELRELFNYLKERLWPARQN